MKRPTFLILVATIIFLGAWTFRRQQSLLAEARSNLNARAALAAPTQQSEDRPTNAPSLPPERPSPELLRLRNEVTLLHRDLEKPPPPLLSQERQAEDWALVHSGVKPSEQPGFRHFANLTNVGYATPEAAFQSFNSAMRNQHKEPMNNTRMKELWDVPDDFDDPDARYSIDLGEGMGPEFGYRLVGQELIATNQVRLTIDFEKPDGNSFRRQKVLIEKNGRWRMKPARVTRERSPEEK